MNAEKHRAKTIIVNYHDALGQDLPRMVRDAATRAGLKDYANLKDYELEPFTVMLWAQFTGTTRAVLLDVTGREVELAMPPQVKALDEKWHHLLFPNDAKSPSGD